MVTDRRILSRSNMRVINLRKGHIVVKLVEADNSPLKVR
jgi:hypothetical protein